MYAEEKAKSAVVDLEYSFPDKPMPIAPQRSYQLVIDVLEGFLLPEGEVGLI